MIAFLSVQFKGWWSLVVFKKEDKFAVHLQGISQVLMDSANYFVDYMKTEEKDLIAFSEQMKVYEKNADTKVHAVIRELNNVFITAIEREDILALAVNMDDVLDGLEQTAALFEMYSITEADEYILTFADAILNCVMEIDEAVGMIFTKKLPEITHNAIKIKDWEAQCDDTLRRSIKNLFKMEKDPIRIIQYKEIYEELEEVSDYCQDVANIFEAVIMKNA